MRVSDFIYKVVLDETPPRKMIAFIAPNRDTKKKPWQLAVTMIVDGCWANQRPSEITMRTEERYPLALRMGTYHVWHGQLVNCANSFGE